MRIINIVFEVTDHVVKPKLIHSLIELALTVIIERVLTQISSHTTCHPPEFSGKNVCIFFLLGGRRPLDVGSEMEPKCLGGKEAECEDNDVSHDRGILVNFVFD